MENKEITFLIVTFQSEKIIHKCLNELPKESPKIIVENSGNKTLKEDLESKYQNLECFIMSKNLGYGKANNLGIIKSKTNYVFIINPDTFISKDKFNLFLSKISKENFSIASLLENDDRSHNDFNIQGVKEVNFVKGFAMLIDKKKMCGQYFDENIFLYLEEVDLCLNIKKRGGRIILVDIKIQHLGGNSHNNLQNFEIIKSRNWHWMWSKFYFNKKHNGYFLAFIKTLPNLFSSLFKYGIYKVTLNSKQKIIYKMRFLGLLNSYLLKKSFYRPHID